MLRARRFFEAGRLRECLATAEVGLHLAQGDLALGADRIGMSPGLALSSWRGLALSLMGRPRAGGAGIDRVIELARKSQQFWPLFRAQEHRVITCRVLGEAALALAHGGEGVDYAERTGNQMGRIWARLFLGFANVLNGAWRDALEVLS